MSTYTIRPSNQEDVLNSFMSKAAFNALAAERRANRAGSGFDEMGKHHSVVATYPKLNEGIWTNASYVNKFKLGYNWTDNAGVSNTPHAVACCNGVVHKLDYLALSGAAGEILLPPAPTVLPYDATLTTEQIAMGVIKHADSSNSGLIVNGKFTTDTSGWNAYNAASLSVVAGALRVTSTTTSWATTSQAIQCVVGKKYSIEINVSNLTVTSYLYSFTGVSAGAIATLSVQNGRNVLEFTATQTTHYVGLQVASAVIGSYTDFDNISVFPVDAISRSDLVFLESWHEDVSEKDFVYPLGNVQYLGGVTDGMSAIVAGAFSGSGTYSLFGNWQASGALVGKGYVWSTMTDAQKKAFIGNPGNNCYLDGDKVIQVRYRVRVIAGMGDSWANVNPATTTYLTYANTGSSFVSAKGKAVDVTDYRVGNTNVYLPTLNTSSVIKENGVFEILSTAGATFSYNSQVFALPIALVHRRNSGIAHSVFNSNGSKLASDSLPWYSTTVSFTSIADCFDPTKILTASGYIGSVSGRPDELFYDQVHEGDIIDLRMSSAKVEDYNRLISREFNKLVAGTYRGSEKEPFTESKLQTTTGTVATIEVNDGTAYESGSTVQVFDLTAGVVKGRFTVKSVSANTLTVDTTFSKLANVYVIGGGKR